MPVISAQGFIALCIWLHQSSGLASGACNLAFPFIAHGCATHGLSCHLCRAMRSAYARPACAVQPPQLLVIPYTPNVIDVADPGATFKRPLPTLAKRTTLVYVSAQCSRPDGDNMGKRFRCAASYSGSGCHQHADHRAAAQLPAGQEPSPELARCAGQGEAQAREVTANPRPWPQTWPALSSVQDCGLPLLQQGGGLFRCRRTLHESQRGVLPELPRHADQHGAQCVLSGSARGQPQHAAPIRNFPCR